MSFNKVSGLLKLPDKILYRIMGFECLDIMLWTEEMRYVGAAPKWPRRPLCRVLANREDEYQSSQS